VHSRLNPDGYAPGIPFYESDQTIQLTQVKYLFAEDGDFLLKELLDQLFALIPNVEKVDLDFYPD
jgi:hypothetical protein